MPCAIEYDYPLRVRFFNSDVVHAARYQVHYGDLEFVTFPCRATTFHREGGDILVLENSRNITCKLCQAVLFSEHSPVEKRFVVKHRETGEYFKRSSCKEERFTPSLADATMWRTEEGPLTKFGQAKYYDNGHEITRKEYYHLRWEWRVLESKRSKLHKEIIPKDNIEIKSVSFQLGD